MGWVGQACTGNTHIIYNALVQGAFLVGCRIENSHYVAGDKKAHRHIDRNTYYIPTNIIKVHGKGKGLGSRLGFILRVMFKVQG